MVLSDRQIAFYAEKHRMIMPFIGEQVRTNGDGRKLISFGLSSYGYDARCGNSFKIFTNAEAAVIDPKNFKPKSFVEREVPDHEAVVIPPNSFALTSTKEWFEIPRNVLTICLGKSTYARCGLIVNVTPLEPEWHGHVTVEVSNTTPLPARLYAGEGLCQFVFLRADEVCQTSYADKNGKYQNQEGVQIPLL